MAVLKKFLGYYRPYKRVFFIDMFCALLLSVIDLAFPQILNYLTNVLVKLDAQAILRTILIVGLALMLMYVVKYFCQYYITSWGHVMGARMETDMRRDLFNHLQRLSFSYYDENNTGEMMSKLVSDLFDISELAHHGPENVFISVLKIAGSFILLAMINLKMTLILFAVSVVMLVFTVWQNRRMRSIFTDNRRKIADVNSSVQDSLAGIRVVKSFANEEIEKQKFGRRNSLYLTSKISSYKMMGTYQAVNSFFEGMLYVAVLVSGAFFIANGTLKVTDLAIYALYINIFISPIDVLINFTEMFQKGYAGFKRFIEVVETRPEIVDKKDAVPLKNVRGDIEFRNVSFSYDGVNPVLANVSIHIPGGRKVALVGPSGGGKTTICSLLPRFYDVTSGAVLIDGLDVRDIRLNSLRNSIGIVQQDVYMFAGTIRDNILYGRPDASDEDVVRAARQANIHDFIMTLEDGYDTSVGERGVKLSGGQKQRISIARVFLKNPPILILDEATSALDNESERYIQNSLEELAKGRTTIVIAHRLSTIRNADEIIVINDEGIRERGSHAELMRQGGLYARYYNMQFEGLEAAEPSASAGRALPGGA